MAGFISSAAISFYIYLFLPDYMYYRGLSGVLHGWYVGMAMWAIWQQRGVDQFIGALIFIALIIKIGVEQMGYFTATRQILDVEVLYEAHTVGWISVMVFTFFWAFGVRLIKKKCINPQ